jgi:hypothetical protein
MGYEVQPFNLTIRVPNAIAVFDHALADGPDAAYRLVRAFNEGESRQGGAFLIEARAEQIRAADFPDCPRRWDCTFATRTLAEALDFGKKYGRQHAFEVQPIGEPQVWCGDFAVLTVGPDLTITPGVGMDALDARLRTYWQTLTKNIAAAPASWELLVVGRLRVTSACLAP